MRRLLLAPLTAAVLAVAGCGGDDEADTASAPAEAPAAESTESSAAPASEANAVAIGMKGLQFDPKEVTVKVGTTVTWTNLEDIPHNVVAEKGADFESDTFGKDGTYEFEAAEAGTVEYVCTLHPGMEGILSVEE